MNLAEAVGLPFKANEKSNEYIPRLKDVYLTELKIDWEKDSCIVCLGVGESTDTIFEFEMKIEMANSMGYDMKTFTSYKRNCKENKR